MVDLAGEIGFFGDVCGALTDGASLLALHGGKGTPEVEKHPRPNLIISKLFEWYTQEYTVSYGGIHFGDIIGNDPGNQSTRCSGVVTQTYEKAKALLLDNSFDLSEGR